VAESAEYDLSGKWLELLKQIAPDVREGNPASEHSASILFSIPAALHKRPVVKEWGTGLQFRAGPNQKPRVLLDDVVERAVCGVEAVLEGPMIDCAIFCALKSLAPGLPVIDASPTNRA
jgi:hypothetical protein